MTLEGAIDLSREALIMSLLISAPVLALGLLVGLVIALFQAVTSLQEQTLQFVPKIAAMTLAGVFFGPWLVVRMIEYARALLGSVPF
jgi:flagellar biosynthetic protein FliQ